MKSLRRILLAPLLMLAACHQPAHEAESSPFIYTLDAPGAVADAALPINKLCPIGKEPILKGGKLVLFHGHAIGFCCDDCLPEFQKLDDAGKTAALAAVGTTLSR